jgi:hypothetical protein
MVVQIVEHLCHMLKIATNTTGKRHSFVGVFIFVDTDEYIQIIFVGF